jgi:anaerobic C4-dicarboxylate transporter
MQAVIAIFGISWLGITFFQKIKHTYLIWCKTKYKNHHGYLQYVYSYYQFY